MKRFATAAIAAVTAISLSTTAAVAQSSDDDNNSGDVSPGHETSADIVDSSTDNSSVDVKESSNETWFDVFESSYENDADQEWALGSSADLIIGALLALGGAAFVMNNGSIPGLQLPGF